MELAVSFPKGLWGKKLLRKKFHLVKKERGNLGFALGWIIEFKLFYKAV